MTDNFGQRPRTFLGLRGRLLIAFTLVFSAVFAGAYYWFYSFATATAMERIADDMVDTLHGAVAGIDSEEFARLTQRELPEGAVVPADDPLYREHQEWLSMVHKVEPRSIPYTFIAGDEPHEVLWIGDIFRVIRPEDGTAFRESYRNPESSIYQGLTRLTVSIDPYQDPWGYWVSAYGPILDAEGNSLGAVGIDFRADHVYEVQESIRGTMLVAFAVTYGTLFFLVYLLSNVLTRPIAQLTRIVEKVGEGDYRQDFGQLKRAHRRDEIGILADVFQTMVAKVYQREQRLRQEVSRLKIEVDEAKRQQQVSEIVETDFFRDLQAKTQELRDRYRRRAAKVPTAASSESDR